MLYKRKLKEWCAGLLVLSKRLTLSLPAQRALISSMPVPLSGHKLQKESLCTWVSSRYSVTLGFESSGHREKIFLSKRSCGEGKLIFPLPSRFFAETPL